MNFKSFVNGLADADGVQDTFTLFVPRKSGDQAVGICPNVTSLESTNPNCANVTYKSINDSDVSTVTVDGTEYFKVSGLTGTGGFSIEDLPQTGQRIKIPLLIGAGILFFATWIILSRRIYKLRSQNYPSERDHPLKEGLSFGWRS